MDLDLPQTFIRYRNEHYVEIWRCSYDATLMVEIFVGTFSRNFAQGHYFAQKYRFSFLVILTILVVVFSVLQMILNIHFSILHENNYFTIHLPFPVSF